MLYTFLTLIQGERAQNVTVGADISVSRICMYHISADFSKPLWSHLFSHNHTGFSESDSDIEIQTVVTPLPAFVTCVAAQTESDVNSDVLVTLQTVVIGH